VLQDDETSTNLTERTRALPSPQDEVIDLTLHENISFVAGHTNTAQNSTSNNFLPVTARAAANVHQRAINVRPSIACPPSADPSMAHVAATASASFQHTPPELRTSSHTYGATISLSRALSACLRQCPAATNSLLFGGIYAPEPSWSATLGSTLECPTSNPERKNKAPARLETASKSSPLASLEPIPNPGPTDMEQAISPLLPPKRVTEFGTIDPHTISPPKSSRKRHASSVQGKTAPASPRESPLKSGAVGNERGATPPAWSYLEPDCHVVDPGRTSSSLSPPKPSSESRATGPTQGMPSPFLLDSGPNGRIVNLEPRISPVPPLRSTLRGRESSHEGDAPPPDPSSKFRAARTQRTPTPPTQGAIDPDRLNYFRDFSRSTSLYNPESIGSLHYKLNKSLKPGIFGSDGIERYGSEEVETALQIMDDLHDVQRSGQLVYFPKMPHNNVDKARLDLFRDCIRYSDCDNFVTVQEIVAAVNSPAHQIGTDTSFTGSEVRSFLQAMKLRLELDSLVLFPEFRRCVLETEPSVLSLGSPP